MSDDVLLLCSRLSHGRLLDSYDLLRPTIVRDGDPTPRIRRYKNELRPPQRGQCMPWPLALCAPWIGCAPLYAVYWLVGAAA